MKHILEMATDRGAYICQSQSTNLWMESPTYNKLTAMHFFSWKKGLKTGIYYLRTKAKKSLHNNLLLYQQKKIILKKKKKKNV